MSTWDKIKKLMGWGPECKNGDRDNTGNCICPPYFNGTLCENIICLHGGVSNLDQTSCHCEDPKRFSGIHCEFLNCDNGGRDSGQGHCECVDEWYTGRFCERYASPWIGVFAVLATLVVLLVLVCVVCRLKLCNRNRRRRAEGQEDREWRAPNRSRGASRSQSRESNESRGVPLIGSNLRSHPISAPLYQPRPLISRLHQSINNTNQDPDIVSTEILPELQPPPPYDATKITSNTQPPSYEEVLNDPERYPSNPPIIDQGEVSTTTVICPNVNVVPRVPRIEPGAIMEVIDGNDDGASTARHADRARSNNATRRGRGRRNRRR